MWEYTAVRMGVAVLAIYIIFGPLILLLIYSLFDRLAEKEGRSRVENKDADYNSKDPALWSAQDVQRFLKEQR